MKQLIILSCVIPIGTVSEVKSRSRLSEFKAILDQTFSQELQEETNTTIRYIIVPTTRENDITRIECIYPKGSSENDILEKLNLLEQKTKRIKI